MGWQAVAQSSRGNAAWSAAIGGLQLERGHPKRRAVWRPWPSDLNGPLTEGHSESQYPKTGSFFALYLLLGRFRINTYSVLMTPVFTVLQP